MSTPEETWKGVTVSPYEDTYEVSDLGNVRKASGKLLKPHPRNNYGHLCIDFWKNGARKTVFVHRLVAFAFLGEPPSAKHEVRHLDGNSANNAVDNLKWGTSSEDTADCRAHGTMPIGDKHKNTKIPDWGIKRIFDLRKRGWTQAEIAKVFGVHRVHIGDILNGSKRAYAQPNAVRG